MADWSTFTGIVGVILLLLLALTHASQSIFDDESRSSTETRHSTGRSSRPTEPRHPTASTDHRPRLDSPPADTLNDAAQPADGSASADKERPNTEHETADRPETGDETTDRPVTPGPTTEVELSTPILLANVAVSQAVFAVLLVTMAWYTEIPAWAFGLAAESLTLGGVATGVAVGAGCYILNEGAAAVGRRRGLSTPTGLREALAPETAVGWTLLLVVVLPIIAGFEELLFRGALIGVINAGFGVPVWLLAVGSSVAFGLGHGAQGRLGVVVTGLLGLGLAGVFVLTGSLLVVIVAHYVINALEFVMHEGVDRDELSRG